MCTLVRRSLQRLSVFLFSLTLTPLASFAGGPKYIAGASYFDPAVLGQPVHWSGGLVRYYVDQGPLNSQVTNQQATAMVDTAAALWSSVSTAGVTLRNAGSLSEDVSGSNVVPGNAVFAQPADVAPSATNYPVAVIYDSDGAVIDSIFGTGASDPATCQNNSVMVWLDNIRPDATTAHAAIVLNGLCAANSNLLAMMNYELERAFGQLLGLGYSQVNPGAATNFNVDWKLGWPIMNPTGGVCGGAGGICIPNPGTLRYDDIAALNRIYPITVDNLAGFPGKQITAANTVSIRGTIGFRSGLGMQGVNVVARPLDASGNPLYQYTVTFVSGSYFNGKHGNPVTGWTDANQELLTKWGSSDPAMQGYFDLGGIPLPPGMATADYQLTFEPIDPLYMLSESVGPYVDGTPTPSGTMPVISVLAMAPGSARTIPVNIADSSSGGYQGAIATEAAPRMLQPSGLWCGRLGQVGQADWFIFPVRAGRAFTVVTQALNEKGIPTNRKSMPAIGVWDAFLPVGAPSVAWAPGLNGGATGESSLQVITSADDVVRLGIADMRGDGRPDYTYNGWVLYADTVQPQHLPASGGNIVIRGMGFRPSDTVLVGGRKAVVTSISPNEITAIAPAAGVGVSGSVDVEVDDLPIFYASAILTGAISYDAGTGDSLTLNTAPSNTVPIGVPIPFTVTALTPSLTPAGGVTVAFTVSAGTATLGCGLATCLVVATGDGIATMSATVTGIGASVVIASLTNGASLQAHFSGGTPPVIAAITPSLSLAAGAIVNWTTQALVLNNGNPVAGQTVTWQTGANVTTLGPSSAITGGNGIAAKSLKFGPLAKGQQTTATACLNGTSQCVNFTINGARPEYAYLQPIAGTLQSVPASGTPAQVTLRLHDMNGNPMAGGNVTLHQALYAWAPPCPPHGRCAQSELLATQTSSATSAIDGSVTFIPASLFGAPTNTIGLAASGNSSTLTIAIEQHP
jgi:hypothetical protein